MDKRKPGLLQRLSRMIFGLPRDTWAAMHGVENATGIIVNPDKAMRLSAVWACVRLISQTIATLPVGIYQRTDEGRLPANKLTIASLIRQRPNSKTTAVLFWESMLAAAMLHGAGRAEKKVINGRIVALDFLVPWRLSIDRSTPQMVMYRYTDKYGATRDIPEDRIFSLQGFALDGECGLSVVEYGAEVFGAAYAGNEAAAGTFKRGLLPTVAFKYPQVMRKEQRDDARTAIERLSGAVNAGKPVILEAGTDALEIGIKPSDAQLLESRAFSIEEICRWFGVPPSMIGHTDKASSWASSAEQLNLWFLQYALRPWLKRAEEAIWADLLTPVERIDHYAEFNVDGLLRANTEGRSRFYSTALQNGWMSRNEVRRLENLPPVEGGDIYTAQSNLVSLEKLDQVTPGTPAAAVRAALQHWLKETEE